MHTPNVSFATCVDGGAHWSYIESVYAFKFNVNAPARKRWTQVCVPGSYLRAVNHNCGSNEAATLKSTQHVVVAILWNAIKTERKEREALLVFADGPDLKCASHTHHRTM